MGLACWLPALLLSTASATEIQAVAVEGQPLGANVTRLVQALDYLGSPFPEAFREDLMAAVQRRDANKLQQLLDPHVLLVVSINPESRVKVQRGPAEAVLQQAGFTPVLVKILNDSTVTKRLRITSPQSGPVYAGVAELSMQRQQQEELRENENIEDATDRFLSIEMFHDPPMMPQLSGLAVEYAVALIYSSEAGKREATIGFDVGQGNQDLGFRGETPVLFKIEPAIPARLNVRDVDGRPTVARLLFHDDQGRIYPPQPKRLAPDFFFQPHIYRVDGQTVLLPPGRLAVQYSRGPEYRVRVREIDVPKSGRAEIDIQLERWIDPMQFGYYSGDHHIHAAGCAHYTSPTEGVLPKDMFLQVKGEGLNVGCILTWGPCFEFQRQFFEPVPHEVSEPLTLLKYDLEISGFGSQALGHVCLLRLNNQTYPGSEGTATQGWPTWTTPVMRWAKQQGVVTGYAHSASGLKIDPAAAARRLLAQADRNTDSRIRPDEAEGVLLPEAFAAIDLDEDRTLTERELALSHDRVADQLPNLAIPEMNGVGAMEISVSTAEGVCDFISAMDTPRIQEWNCWYHILNCGFPLKVSGETDFPCMSSRSVGQGRVYVHLSSPEEFTFDAWCEGLAAGRSYVSDGYAHAVEFTVNQQRPGGDPVALQEASEVRVQARVAFAPEIPAAVAYGTVNPEAGPRVVGDTVVLHGPRQERMVAGGERRVEVVVNGRPVASAIVPADGQLHELSWSVPIHQSSWVALRQFPQLHTNPVDVIVAGKPIRASADSARWCIETIKLLWNNRRQRISSQERVEAEQTFERAIGRYEQIATEARRIKEG